MGNKFSNAKAREMLQQQINMAVAMHNTAQECYNQSQYEDALVKYNETLTMYQAICKEKYSYELYRRMNDCKKTIGVIYIKLLKFEEASKHYFNLAYEHGSKIKNKKLNEDFFTGLLCMLVIPHENWNWKDSDAYKTLEDCFGHCRHSITLLNMSECQFIKRLQYRIENNKGCHEVISNYEDFLQFTEPQRLCLNEISKRSSHIEVNLLLDL